MSVIKKSNIPEGKVIFLPAVNCRHNSYSYENFEVLEETTNSNNSLFRVHRYLKRHLEPGTNKLFSINESVRSLADKLNISINSVTPTLTNALDVGMIKVKPDTDYYVYNPYIAFKGMFSDFSLLELFKDSPQYSDEGYQFIIMLKLENNIYVEPDHNIYILEHELSYGYRLFKIGVSDNIEKRLQTYLGYNPSIRLIGSLKVENPRQFEKELHKKFWASYGKEWYNLWTMQKINQTYNLGLNL